MKVESAAFSAFVVASSISSITSHRDLSAFTVPIKSFYRTAIGQSPHKIDLCIKRAQVYSLTPSTSIKRQSQPLRFGLESFGKDSVISDSVISTIVKSDAAIDANKVIHPPETTFNENDVEHSENSFNYSSDPPPASFSIETKASGPDGSLVTTVSIHLGAQGHPDPIIIETGKIGRQASGSVTLSRGQTILYVTASRDKETKDSIDFAPLSVEHQERFSSAGLTSGAYNRRDGRPAEHEVLTCRLIDRPLRPLIHPGWRHETQILSWVLSYDGERSCDPLAITASAAALWISDVPLSNPVAAVMVGYIDGQFFINPTIGQMERSKLNLTVAGTKDAVLMIEGAADFLPEDLMIQAVAFGHNSIKIICKALEAFGKVVGKPKYTETLVLPLLGLQEEVESLMGPKVDAMYSMDGAKETVGATISKLSKEVCDSLDSSYPNNKNEIKGAFKNLLIKKMFEKAKKTGLRYDGRALHQVRPITIATSILPRVHGSALFTRGQTQAIATVTLGDSGMKQKIDKLDGLEEKRFYLQYTFPPSSVGETGRVGAPGRREIGHGNLAERALAAIIPTEDIFPYSIRVESLITESHGSSSMASVCGGSLALMDAGVPVKRPVAGIAMGMLLGTKDSVSDENAVILSDISGTEDALGTMDFKVAGDREGITTFQLDIKCEGLTIETMKQALEQAKEGRLHILNEMSAALASPRGELHPSVPRILSFKIPEESIGKVIGPGGKQIRAIIEDFELTNMDVEEDGMIQITSQNAERLKAAELFVMDLIGGKGTPGKRAAAEKLSYTGPEPEVGTVYKGKITGVHQFGVFIEIMPGAEDGSYPGLEGLCHVSELHTERVRNCEAFVSSLGVAELEVKYLGKNDKGKIQLSRKAVIEDRKAGKGRTNNGGKEKNVRMNQDEIDVIAQAINGIRDLI